MVNDTSHYNCSAKEGSFEILNTNIYTAEKEYDVNDAMSLGKVFVDIFIFFFVFFCLFKNLYNGYALLLKLVNTGQ